MKTLPSILATTIMLASMNSNAGLIPSNDKHILRTNLTASQALDISKNKLWDFESGSYRNSKELKLKSKSKSESNNLQVNDDLFLKNRELLNSTTLLAYLGFSSDKKSVYETDN